MELNKIADILFNMSLLDTNYTNGIEFYKKTVAEIKSELKNLKSKNFILFYVLKMIAMQNEDLFEWALNKENNYVVTVVASKECKLKAETPELAEIKARKLCNNGMIIDSVIVKESE